MQPEFSAGVYPFASTMSPQKCLKGHLILLTSLLYPLILAETPFLLYQNINLKLYLMNFDLIQMPCLFNTLCHDNALFSPSLSTFTLVQPHVIFQLFYSIIETISQIFLFFFFIHLLY